VNVNKTRGDDQSFGVNLSLGVACHAPDLCDAPAFYGHVGEVSRIARAIRDATATDDNVVSFGAGEVEQANQTGER
jgi:hypothetical protein